jgi:hypothetical protein
MPNLPEKVYETCQEWYRAAGNFTNDEELANAFNVRVGSVIKFVRSETANFTYFVWGINFTTQTEFIVETRFDQTLSLRVTYVPLIVAIDFTFLERSLTHKPIFAAYSPGRSLH